MLSLKKLALFTLLFACSCTVFCAGNDKDSWPFKDIPVDGAVKLADGWHYAWDWKDQGMNENWSAPNFNRESWKSVSVPGVWDLPPGKIPMQNPRGVGWFACKIRLPENWNGEPTLVFFGAMYIADVWFDGEYLGNHRGGYTPFSFSLDGKLKHGEEKEIVVRIDNRLTHKSIPGINLGWNPYGGLTREVFLISRPHIRVEDLHTVTKVDAEGTARLCITGKITNHAKEAFTDELTVMLKADDKTCAQSIIKSSLKPGTSESFKIDFEIAKAKLWSPEDPFLHILEMTWRGNTNPHIRLPVGLREIRIDGPNFLVNNKRLWLQGFGRHEDWKDYGPCIPRDLDEQEIIRMKNFGANHLRTGHYPNHPSTYATCDRIGMLTFAEIPAWQLSTAWMNSDQAWNDWAEPQISEMIRWHGNFTSIISWGSANEMGDATEYNNRSVSYIKEKDPNRIPMIVVAATGHSDLYKLLPMAGRNLHYGWYHSKRVYDGLRNGLAENVRLSEEVNTPIWVAELGAQGHPGAFTAGYNDELRGSETYLDKVVRFGFQYSSVTSERVIGVAVWTWSDFCRDYSITPHGIFGFGRENKIVAYTARNLFAGDLRLYLCEDDTTCHSGGVFRAKAHVFNPKLQQVPLGLTVNWRIMHGAKPLISGKLPVPEGKDRALSAGEISWRIPVESKGMFSLWAELVDNKETRLHTNSVHFGAGEPVEKPGALVLTAVSNGKAVDAIAEFAEMKIPVYCDPGLIIPLPAGDYDFIVKRGDESKPIKVQIISGTATVIKVEFK
ncbi:MAG TPA: hypothetical protein DCZ94_07920 [Lentisphaeria bacterium]|nr:MAG: hypothetical protein A2X48_24320 [Lentisphaerae bacterium GWF2_49_21]HBC86864.1 hypothetical protein [Lentisphaeria bacterium]